MNRISNYAAPAERGDEDLIDPIPLLKALWRGAWLILTAAFLTGSLAYLGTKLLITPTYRTIFIAYVNNRNQAETATSLTSSDLSAAQSLVHTYASILTSRSVLVPAAQQAGLDPEIPYKELLECVTVEIVDGTELLSVSVTMEDPYQAKAFADTICEMAPEHVAQIVEGTSMQIVDAPVLPAEIYQPGYLRNTLIGILIGLVLAAGGIVLCELLNDRIENEEQLEKLFGIAVIGTIPDLVEAGKQDSHAYRYGYGKKGGSAS